MTGQARIALAFIYSIIPSAAPIGRCQDSSALNASVATDIPTLIREGKAASDKNWEAMIRRYSDYSLKRRRVLRKTKSIRERIDFKLEQFDYVAFSVEVEKGEVVPR
jgi:hypothetical protein